MWEMERMEVEDRIDSDHFPMVIWLKDEEGDIRKRSGKGRKKWRWSEEEKAVFRKKIEKVWESKRRYAGRS